MRYLVCSIQKNEHLKVAKFILQKYLDQYEFQIFDILSGKSPNREDLLITCGNIPISNGNVIASIPYLNELISSQEARAEADNILSDVPSLLKRTVAKLPITLESLVALERNNASIFFEDLQIGVAPASSSAHLSYQELRDLIQLSLQLKNYTIKWNDKEFIDLKGIILKDENYIDINF